MVEDRDVIRSPDTGRAQRVPPGQRIVEEWPVLHHGAMPHIDVDAWTFTISGLVEKELTLDFEDFMSLPRTRVFSDIHCVTGWSLLDNLWEGVSTSEIRELVAVLPDARFVIVHSVGGFTTNLTLSDFFEPDVLFATRHNEETLALEHGYPVRLMVPRLYLWKSAKWVVGIEFRAEDTRGFWESRGYHNRGDPWMEERYSR